MPRKLKTILLVDDNPVAQRITAKVFNNAGYQVILAWNQEECLEMAKTRKPDAILMDIIFPEGNGREFVKKLKKDPDTKNIPVIFATNTLNVKDDNGDLVITIGGESYRAFAKPLHYPKLLSTIRKEINRSLSALIIFMFFTVSTHAQENYNLQIKKAMAKTYTDIVREYNVSGLKKKEWLYSMVCLNMAYLQFGGGRDAPGSTSSLNRLIRQKLKQNLSADTLKRLGAMYSLE